MIRYLPKLVFRYSFTRIINYFAIIGIFLSICCLFTVNAVFRGFDHELRSLFRGSLADHLVDWKWKSPKLEEIPSLMPSLKWSPALEGFGMIKTPYFVSAIQLKGIDPVAEMELRKAMQMSPIDFSKMNQDIKESPMGGILGLFGRSSTNEPPAPIMIGHILAQDLNLTIDDEIELVLPNWADQISQKKFKVCAIFKSGIYEDDRSKVYIPIKNAQSMLKHPAGFTYLQVATPDKSDIESLQEFQKKNKDASVMSWEQKHKYRLRAIAHERKLIVVILSLIVVVSSFGILAIQWSFVQEKTSDIGILRTLGFSGSQIFLLFLGVSWFVGLLGLSSGLIGGYFLSHHANELLNLFGWQLFPDDLYYQDDLPVSIKALDFIWISLLSLFVTTLAGFLPAWRAIRVNPIQAISYE